ncbi:MAG: carboxypeptidase-like regulatory domain-containing protein [Planctomycetota bacterium]
MVDTEGRPVTGAHVECYGVGDSFVIVPPVQTGDDGVFSFGPLPDNEYEVTACGPGAAPSGAVAAKPGDTGLLLALRPAGTVAGCIADARTKERCAAEIWVASGGELLYVRDSGFSDSLFGSLTSSAQDWEPPPDGEFSFGDLLPGVYDLTAIGAGDRVGVARRVEVVAGKTTHVEFWLEQGAELRIGYRGPGEQAEVDIFAQGGLCYSTGLAPGMHGLFVVPAGEVTVECTEGETKTAQQVSLQPGERKVLAFGNRP